MDIVLAMCIADTRAKGLFCSTIILNSLLASIGILAVLIINSTSHIILGSLAFLIRIVIFFAKDARTSYSELATKLRQIAMLEDGMDIEPDKIELLQLEAQIGKIDPQDAVHTPPYYASPLPKGAKRLADITGECAFFSGNIARRLTGYAMILGATGLVFVLVIFYAALNVGLQTATQTLVARVVVIVALFFAVGDLATLQKNYSKLADKCDMLLRKCDNYCKKSDITDFEANSVLAEYVCTVSHSPPLPTFVYDAMKDDLNRLWRRHRGFDEN